MAAAIQDEPREVGISLGGFLEIPAGQQDGSLELAPYARTYGITTQPVAGALADLGEGGGDWGAMNWTRPDVAEAQRTVAAGTGEEAEPVALIAGARAQDLPVIPLVWYRQSVAPSGRIENAVIDPLGRSHDIERIRWAE